MSLSTTIIPQTHKLVLTVSRHETAQIALVGEMSWKIIGPYWEETGLFEEYPLPRLDCPVVDLTSADPEQVGKVIRRSVGPAGCSDVPSLVLALTSIGAKVIEE